MASRKPKYDVDRVYKVVYRSGTDTFYASVAACNYAAAEQLFRDAVGSHIINSIERTDITVYYGVNR